MRRGGGNWGSSDDVTHTYISVGALGYGGVVEVGVGKNETPRGCAPRLGMQGVGSSFPPRLQRRSGAVRS